jgi:hypothetical protein
MIKIATKQEYQGRSTETKPTDLSVGSTFFEYDTMDTYCWDGSFWLPIKMATCNTLKETIDLNQAAASYDLFTIGSNDVMIYSLCVVIPSDLTGAGAGALTAISVQSTDVVPVVFISAASGAKANLTSGKHLIYSGRDVVATTKKIQLTIVGGATGAAQVCEVFISYGGVL